MSRPLKKASATKEPKEPQRAYWDACVFLSYIEQVPGRLATLEQMLEDCKKGELEIYTSHLSLVEVGFAQAEKQKAALSIEVQNEMDRLWAPPSRIRLAEVSPLVALDARGLLRQARVVDGIALKPCDAIHLATAKRLGLRLFHTYDGKLAKFSTATGLKIEPPDSGKLGLAAPTSTHA